jgi:hypothetical protein
VKAHLTCFAQLQKVAEARNGDIPPGQISAEDAASNILSILSAGDEPLMTDDYVEPDDFLPSLREYLADQSFFLEFLSVHAQRLDVPVMVQPSVLSMVAEVSVEVPSLQAQFGQGASGRVPIRELLYMIGNKLYTLFSEQWASFGSEMLRLCAASAALGENDESSSPNKVSAGLFETWQDVDSCFKRRSIIMLELASKLMSGNSRVCSEDAESNVAALRGVLDSLCACELRIPQDTFADFWERVLTSDPSKLASVLLMTLKERSPKKMASFGTSMQNEDSQDKTRVEASVPDSEQ